MGGKSAAQFEVLPLTYILPHEYTQFVRAFTEAESAKNDGVEPIPVNAINATAATATATTTTAAQSQQKNSQHSSVGDTHSSRLARGGIDPRYKYANYWIMKPVGLSRGRGITLINDLGAISYSQVDLYTLTLIQHSNTMVRFNAYIPHYAPHLHAYLVLCT